MEQSAWAEVQALRKASRSALNWSLIRATWASPWEAPREDLGNNT
jgi:hypothetical protein